MGEGGVIIIWGLKNFEKQWLQGKESINQKNFGAG